MTLALDLVQSSVLAILLLLLGDWARHKFHFLRRFSFPAPVIGGFLFALLVLLLRQTNVATIEFDTSLQSPAMVAFFTTIGLGGSFALIKKGGRLLIVYVVACWLLAIFQNLVGMGMAKVTGVEMIFGIMAGATSLEGGHGAAAAFGSTAEELGFAGASTVALSAATFGLVAGSLLGGPLAVWLMNRHKIKVPDAVEALEETKAKNKQSASSDDDGRVVFADGTEDEFASRRPGVNYPNLIRVGVVIGAVMVIGMLLSDWFSEVTGFALPAYVGAMIIAVIFRNVNDAANLVRVDEETVNTISKFTLGFFLTLAMMSLKIWELADLALPLIAILVVQVIFIIVMAAFVLFPALGKNYDAATMVAGFMGHGLGATPNALANMDAFNAKFGVRAERAFLIVPLAGAVLIDIVALPWITWCIAMVS